MANKVLEITPSQHFSADAPDDTAAAGASGSAGAAGASAHEAGVLVPCTTTETKHTLSGSAHSCRHWKIICVIYANGF